MRDFIRKIVLTGLGFAAVSKKKIEELGKEISEQMNVSEEEGKKIADEILADTKTMREEFDQRAKDTVKKTIDKLNIPDKEAITKLENRIKKLEKKVSALEKTTK